ncbi:MAG: hypothetical protein ACFCGT_16735 [Sandaracinaceae bacterium]
MEIPPWVKWSRDRARSDESGARLWIRAGAELPWVAVPLFRRVRGYLPTTDGVYVDWRGPVDDDDEDLPVSPDSVVTSAYAYDGSLRWTLHAKDFPFFGRDGARLGGLPYTSSVDGVVHFRSGPWFCVLSDADAPTLGPLQRTPPSSG